VLNALRKFNVSVTLATQTINIFDKDVQMELPALCRLVIMFRVDMNTAKQYAYLFNVAEEKDIHITFTLLLLLHARRTSS